MRENLLLKGSNMILQRNLRQIKYGKTCYQGEDIWSSLRYLRQMEYNERLTL